MLKEMFQREGTPNTVVERLEILNDSQIERILDGTFQGCPRLNSVTCPDCVEEIGACAFRDCAKLTEVMIPGAKKIGAYAFADCSALGSVTLGDGLEYVGRGAFWNCSKLNKINSKLFFNLKSRKLPNEMERLLGKSTLILDGVAVAEPEAFAGCNLLKSIVITFNCPDCVSELEAIGNKIACIVKEACSTTGIIQKAAVVTQIAPLLLSGLDTAIGGFIAHKGTVDGLKVAFPDIVVTHNYDILAYVKKYYFQWIL
jgi:hypothetical protein